jgi:hypothetical protein
MVNSEIYHTDTRQHASFHQPPIKGVYYLGVTMFNMLPSFIKIESDNLKKFRLILQKFLHKNSI